MAKKSHERPELKATAGKTTACGAVALGCVTARERRRSLRVMVLGACLAMVYSVGITSPATTEYFRHIGANEFHFGLIGGVPMVMLLMQFVSVVSSCSP